MNIRPIKGFKLIQTPKEQPSEEDMQAMINCLEEQCVDIREMWLAVGPNGKRSLVFLNHIDKSLIGQFIVTLVLVIVMFAFMLLISLLSLI